MDAVRISCMVGSPARSPAVGVCMPFYAGMNVRKIRLLSKTGCKLKQYVEPWTLIVTKKKAREYGLS